MVYVLSKSHTVPWTNTLSITLAIDTHAWLSISNKAEEGILFITEYLFLYKIFEYPGKM